MTNARFCIIPARALGDKRLNRTDIMVLNALGMFGDKEGWSFPSIGKIAEMIEGHRTSVSKAISNLAECGYVEVRRQFREDGSQTSNEYRILFDAPAQGSLNLDAPRAPEYSEIPPIADSPPPHSQTATPPVASGTMPPIAHTPHLINDPILTPQGNKDIPPKSKNDYPGEFEELWNTWPKERRCEKPEAYKAWRRACEKIAPCDLMACVRRYVDTKEAKEGYAPYPAKWLKRERWIEFPAMECEARRALTPSDIGGDTPDNRLLLTMLEILREKYGEAIFKSWLSQLRFACRQNDVVKLNLPSRFMVERVNKNYGEEISQLAKGLWKHISSVQIDVNLATP